MAFDMPRRLVAPIGGNALHPAGIKGAGQEQADIARKTARTLLPLLRAIPELVITHGNGPQVGKMLMRQALAAHKVAAMPLDICVAHSQGGIAYLLMQAFENALREAGHARGVVSMLTQVEIDAGELAAAAPSKPVGYFFSAEEAKALAREYGWDMREDSGRGWRRVVHSPAPKAIVCARPIGDMARTGHAVIAAGGGGIPVARRPDGSLYGVEAVVDKDLASALLAAELGYETLLILTAVKNVAIRFGEPDQKDLGRVTLAELRKYRRQGHFGAGSMGPKVDAALRFLEAGGERAIIAHLDDAAVALRGEAGTQAVRG